ncbi:hypothetical protein Dimus_025006 [Dionaea muscipula]
MAALRKFNGIRVKEKIVKVKQAVYRRARVGVQINRTEAKVDQSCLQNRVGIDVSGEVRCGSVVSKMRSKDQVFAHSDFLGSSSRSYAEALKGFSSSIPSQTDAGNLCPYIQGVCRESVSLSNKQLFRLMVGKRLFFCRILNEAGDGSEDSKFSKTISCNPQPFELQMEDEQSSIRWKVREDDDAAILRFDVAKAEAILWCNGIDKRRSFNDKTKEPDISEVKCDGGKEAFSEDETACGEVENFNSLVESNFVYVDDIQLGGGIEDNVENEYSLAVQLDGSDSSTVADGRFGVDESVALVNETIERGVIIASDEGKVDYSRDTDIPSEVTCYSSSMVTSNELSIDFNGVILGYLGDPLNMVYASRGPGSIGNILARKKLRSCQWPTMELCA